jgi:hypothetical protein
MWFNRQKREPLTVRRLEERMATLENEQKALELEWTMAYDKLRHMMGRIAKRDAILADKTAGEGTEGRVAPPAVPVSPEREFALAQIAKRRGMG